MSKGMKFNVGDLAQSAPDSSDVTVMKNTWVAEIYKVVCENDHGGCYETVGRWADEPTTNDPTLRQLWGTHLEARRV